MTSIPLLATKLAIPPLTAQIVRRPRLLERLQLGRGRLTLISAPAGSGKTTLLLTLCAQLKNEEKALAWVSLEQADSDPVRFWHYVVAALERASPDCYQASMQLVQDALPSSLETFMTTLLNELAAVKTPTILLLDDYLAITDQAVHDSLTFVIDHLPAQCHVILSSREDPPLPLPRWRVRGMLTELHAVDLQFTGEEVARFFQQTMKLQLTHDELDELRRRTEGWPAGLQLAALALQQHSDAASVGEVIQSFSGRQRTVMAYLTQEVLSQQPEQIRDFLMRTSVLHQLNASLCDAVTLRDDGQAMLERLEGANVFLVPLDEQRCWYRYHQLFAEALRAQLHRRFAGEVAELQKRASRWYRGQGLLSEAIEYALAAQEFGLAAELIEQVAPSLLARHEITALSQWLEALPETVVRASPRLCLALARLSYFLGAIERAESYLEHAEQAIARLQIQPDPLSPRELRGEIAEIRAMVTFFRGDMTSAMLHAQRALDILPEDQLSARSLIALTMGIAASWSGDSDGALNAFLLAQRLSQKTYNSVVALRVLRHLASLYIVRGQLRQAMISYQRMLELIDEHGGRTLASTSGAYIGMGKLYYEWNQLEDAQHYLREGIRIARATLSTETLFTGLLALSKLLCVQGDVEGAFAQLDAANDIFREGPQFIARTTAARVWLWLATHQHERAECWLREHPTPDDELSDGLRESEALALARVHLVQERFQTTFTLLERIRQQAEGAGRFKRVIEVLVVYAVGLDAAGRTDQAIAQLAEALALAEPEGYIRTFLDEGEHVHALLSLLLKRRSNSALSSRVSRSYLATLFQAAQSKYGQQSTATSSSRMREPCSEREVEILRLLARGYANQEIANQLVLTVGTVKRHVHNISGKLGARNRTETVARARELGLL